MIRGPPPKHTCINKKDDRGVITFNNVYYTKHYNFLNILHSIINKLSTVFIEQINSVKLHFTTFQPPSTQLKRPAKKCLEHQMEEKNTWKGQQRYLEAVKGDGLGEEVNS